LEVAESCSWNQLGPLKEELWSKNWDAEQWRLEELSLEEAEFRVKSGEDSAARELLKALKSNWALNGKVLEFFNRVDWKQDKLEFLDQIYSRSLQTLKDQGLTLPLLEALEILYQITQTRAEIGAAAADELKTQQHTFDAQLQQVQRDFQAQLEAVLYSVNHLAIKDFIYNFQYDTSIFHKTNLITGQESSTALTHTFKQGSRLCESPEGNLFITGGGYPNATSEVVCIDPTTNAVTPKPPMNTARRAHGSVFYGGFLYVIGGTVNGACLAECERYDTLHDHWQPIPPLPHASCRHAAIVCGYTRRIYTLGGENGSSLDLIQEFELESQTWKLLEVKLPSKSDNIPCFRVKNQALIYFILGGALHSFSPITYTLANVKPVEYDISYNGPSYFAKGTLYYPRDGPVLKLDIGDLS
jgi:hypothetical protein